MRISDWSSDVCSSDLPAQAFARHAGEEPRHALAAFQIEPQSRLQAVRRAGVADASDAVAEGIVAAAIDRRRQRLHRHAVAAEEAVAEVAGVFLVRQALDRKSTRLNSSH